MENFQKIRDNFVKSLFSFFPTQATAFGVLGYDDKLESFSKGARQEAEKVLSQWESFCQKTNTKNFSLEDKIDFELMKAELFLQRYFFSEFCQWEKDPSLYPETALQSIYYLLKKSDVKKNGEALLLRLKKIPNLFKEAKENLKNPPKIFCDTALEVVEGGISFFKSLTIENLPFPKKLKNECKKERLNVLDGLENYRIWIQHVLFKSAKGNFAAGKFLFNHLLKQVHLLPYDANDLKAIGEENFQKTLRLLKHMARKIDAEKSWKEILLENSKNHPKPERLIPTYATLMEKAKAFILEKRLAPIPKNEAINVNETPSFYRPFLPFAAYMPPPVFQNKGNAELWVTPIPKGLSQEEIEKRLKEHAYHKIPVIVLHETYPGHHLQFSFLRKAKSPLVKRSFVSCEGWALYCEEMMHEEGFYTALGKNGGAKLYKPGLIELAQKRDELWRIARVILDVGLHTEKMKPETAVNFLSQKVQMPKAMAWGEVKRYVREATQPMSYFVGKMQILQLREACCQKKGKFDLFQFHKMLLESGPVPISLVGKRALAQA
jgi:uncharacterized protein (DUF885 family)